MHSERDRMGLHFLVEPNKRMIASLLSGMDVMQRHQSEPQRRVRINGYRRGDWEKVATLINQDNANSREKKGGKQTAEEQERKRKKRVEKCARESKVLIEKKQIEEKK